MGRLVGGIDDGHLTPFSVDASLLRSEKKQTFYEFMVAVDAFTSRKSKHGSIISEQF
jgi:hypothetical protein